MEPFLRSQSQVAAAIMQLSANDQRCLPAKRMKRIEHSNLTTQIPGIMT